MKTNFKHLISKQNQKAEKITIITGESHSVITPMLVPVFLAQTNVLFIFFLYRV
jgi:hypothetical protein